MTWRLRRQATPLRVQRCIAALYLCTISNFALAETLATNSYSAATPAKGLVISKTQLGLGSPTPMLTVGNEEAKYVDDGYYHAPQYMPNYPTAATIWPRVVDVGCEKGSVGIVCEGYHLRPGLGRGEYLFVHPQVKEPATPVVAAPPVIVYREVPVKKKME